MSYMATAREIFKKRLKTMSFTSWIIIVSASLDARFLKVSPLHTFHYRIWQTPRKALQLLITIILDFVIFFHNFI